VNAILDLITSCTIALLAFVIAFYGLLAREKKTPYMVHSAYAIILTILYALVLTLLARIPIWLSLNSREILTIFSSGMLFVILLWVIFKIAQERNRHLFFRNDLWILSPAWQHWLFHSRKKRRYEHTPMEFPDELINSLKACTRLPTAQVGEAIEHYKALKADFSMSAVLEIQNLVNIDKALVDVATRFLDNDCYVQYTSCNRHPAQFLSQLKANWEQRPNQNRTNWGAISDKVVLVDGYTPHFGFADSIYHKWQDFANAECLCCLRSAPSYAGIHTATAQAFNRVKAASKKTGPTRQVRLPSLVIYEGCQALVDLESAEQYRLFVRHVLPSERLWGGMFTLFIEPSIAEDNRAVLKSSADIFFSDCEVAS
jgi:hypothetical protein